MSLTRSFPAICVVGLAALVFACSAKPVRGQSSCARNWSRGFESAGTDGPVHASIVFDDGAGEALYVAGAFDSAGDVIARNVARYDGTHFTSLAGGIRNVPGSASLPVGRAFVVYQGSLYVAGTFQIAGEIPALNIARWDGVAWHGVGGGLGPTFKSVKDLIVADLGNGPILVAAGDFSTAGGVAASGIATWNGSVWSPLGNGLSVVNAVVAFDDGLGSKLFAAAGGYMARWNGVSWTTINVPGNTNSLVVFNVGQGPAIYGGGSGYLGNAKAAVARWTGSNWSALGNIKNSHSGPGVLRLHIHDDGGGSKLFAGGVGLLQSTTPLNHVVKWNGISWDNVGAIQTQFAQVATLASFPRESNSELIAGGGFQWADNAKATNVARWGGAGWKELWAGNGGGLVTNFEPHADKGGSALFASGFFPVPGRAESATMAAWNGTELVHVDTGEKELKRLLGTADDGSGSRFYGHISEYLPDVQQFSDYLAWWDGAAWVKHAEADLPGTNGSYVLNDVVAFDDGSGAALFLAGGFQEIAGVSAKNVAKWQNGAWTAVGAGLPGYPVEHLVVFDDGSGPALYAGGFFGPYGGGYWDLARWKGAEWEPVGGEFHGAIRSMVVYDDGNGPALYISGNLQVAGGVPIHQIARWDGVEWTSVLEGMSGDLAGVIYELSVVQHGPQSWLYAGGAFSEIDGVAALCIARWDGQRWEPLDGGLNSETRWRADVQAMQYFDDGIAPGLFVSGEIAQAGSVPSSNFAKLNFPAQGRDCTGDGAWDLSDFAMLQNCFGSASPSDASCGCADFDDDGVVYVLDYLSGSHCFSN